MRDNTTLYLTIPVRIALGDRTLTGHLALPPTATEVRVSIGGAGSTVEQRRQAHLCARAAIASLNLQSPTDMTSGDLLKVIDWVRSRRLLQPLTVSLVTPPACALAALKAAHHRPASVCGVLTAPAPAARALRAAVPRRR
jgi:hypothetical protein